MVVSGIIRESANIPARISAHGKQHRHRSRAKPFSDMQNQQETVRIFPPQIFFIAFAYLL